MDNFITAYIAHRMAELGFKEYSIEPVLVIPNGGQNEFVIQGQNEYYYLASKVVPDGLEIFADNNYYKSENLYTDVNYSYVQEFTGQVRIVFPPTGSLTGFEFIRVIPQ